MIMNTMWIERPVALSEIGYMLFFGGGGGRASKMVMVKENNQ